MYSNKENVNILTSLLIQYGVEKAVVCPGSRNSPIVHNLNEAEDITCYPVTDERSAAFYALGMTQLDNEPVVLCVTSGSALLNAAPAVAEAYYQHRPLIIVSADRPQQWIDQLDGQTMHQPDALKGIVRKAVSLPEPRDNEEHWYCNRLVNEALQAARHHGFGPVHINVPISEPLYEYHVETLPDERKISWLESDTKQTNIHLIDLLMNDSKPMLIVGQMDKDAGEQLETIKTRITVVHDSLSAGNGTQIDRILNHISGDEYIPHEIVYIGDCVVSKTLRKWLRSVHSDVVMVNRKGELNDVTMHTAMVAEADPVEFLDMFAEEIRHADEQNISGNISEMRNQEYYQLWKSAMGEGMNHMLNYTPSYSSMATVKYFEEQLEDMEYDYRVQASNSSAVRLENIYAGRFVYCNRGINGIEGCISTAAGMSVATGDVVFCLTGDLAFFYDQNALWNKNLKGNLRIIILNNGEGSIFEKFRGLGESKAKSMVTGKHESKAEGICTQNDVGYMKAHSMEEMELGIVRLLTIDTHRPVVLEVFTNAERDEEELENYYK